MQRPKNSQIDSTIAFNSGATRRALITMLLVLGGLLSSAQAGAEILNRNTPVIRIRIGSNSNKVDTVIYTPELPASMNGLPGVTSTPKEISTNNISGARGEHKVRIVTDLNAHWWIAPLSGTFSYNSVLPMRCKTPTSCGTSSIPFKTISWNARDQDTLNSVTSYDGSANQVFQKQRDTNISQNSARTRHRNHYQFVFDNFELLPAGTYEGSVTLSGRGERR